MRTVLFILGGCLIWGACVVLARLVSASAQAMQIAVGLFILSWFGVAAINMCFGIVWAGYSFREELPVFLLIFAAPVVAAVFVKWKWFGGPQA